MARTSITAVAILGLATVLVGCSDDAGVVDTRTYAFADIEGFKPVDGRFTYYEPWSAVSGDSWAEGWPDLTTEVFEPAACLTYMTSVEALLASDESETAADEVSYFGGEVVGAFFGEEGYGSVYVKIRLFETPALASQFVSDFRTSAAPCSGGYSYSWEGWGWTADSVTVSNASLSGIDGVTLVKEQNVNAGSPDEPESSGHFDHYDHYVIARGNVVFIASYAFDAEVVTNEDVVELIGEFIEHLEEAGTGS